MLNVGLNGKKVVHISCGDSSSVAVTDSGEVYSWGHNGVGQLGLGNCTSQVEPQKIATFAKIVIGNIDRFYEYMNIEILLIICV